MNKRILFRIDFQNDFVHPEGKLTISDEKLIDRHQKFANSLFKNSFDKIIDSYDTHFEETYKDTMEAKNFPFVTGSMVRDMIKFGDKRWKNFIAKENHSLVEEYFNKKKGII